MIKKIGLILVASAPLVVATIASITIASVTINTQNTRQTQSQHKKNVTANVEYLIELSKEQQSYFNGELPLSPQQIEFIRDNNNGDDLEAVRTKIAKGQVVKITTDVKQKIIDNYYTKGFFNQQTLKFQSNYKSIDYPIELQKELDGSQATWIKTNQKLITMWKAGKFKFPWDSANYKIVDSNKPIDTNFGKATSFASNVSKYPHQFYMLNKETNTKTSLINDVHSIVYQTNGKQTDGSIGVNRRINPSRKSNFRFLNKIYDNTKTKPSDLATNFNTFAIDRREANLMITELNKYSVNQAAFLVMKKKPKFETDFQYQKVSSFFPANIQHYIVPLETEKWKVIFEQESQKEKVLVKTFSSANKNKPLNVVLKKTDGSTHNLNKNVRYIVFNKKTSDTDSNTLAISRTFSDNNFKYVNKVLRNGQTKDPKRKFDNVMADAASSALITGSSAKASESQVFGIVLSGDLSGLPSDIIISSINGFYPNDQIQKFLPLNGTNYELEFELETQEERTAKVTSPWNVNNIASLRSKIYYDGKKLNQAYMIGYKPKNGLTQNQLSSVWFGKTLHIQADYWALTPNSAGVTSKNGKKNQDKFSIKNTDQEIIKKIMNSTPEEEFGFILVAVKSLPKETTDTLEKISIYKENNGKKKEFQYVVIKTSDPKTTISN